MAGTADHWAGLTGKQGLPGELRGGGGAQGLGAGKTDGSSCLENKGV